MNWDDIFTRNVFVTLGITFLLVLSYVVVSVLKRVFDASIEYGKAHITKLNTMADLVPAIKEDLDTVTGEVKGLRDDIRNETAGKLAAQIEKDSHLESRILSLEKHRDKHNIHDLKEYTHILGGNLEALVKHHNKVTGVAAVGVEPFELRMPKMRSGEERRGRHRHQEEDRDRDRYRYQDEGEDDEG